jgi:hypothetical protein
MAIPLWCLEEERRGIATTRKVSDQLSDYEIRKNFGLPWWGRALRALRRSLKFFHPVETKVLTFLSYLRSGSFQCSLGTLLGVSQTSLSRIIDAGSKYTVSQAKTFVTFPNSVEERTNSKLRFYELSGRKLGAILGVIDGTHVGIKAPKADEFAYVNRKQHH